MEGMAECINMVDELPEAHFFTLKNSNFELQKN
jgi:hypothetical protein